MKNPTVKEIVEKYLKDNGYDGLCGDECGCQLDDLMCCDGENIGSCKGGYKLKLTAENIDNYDCPCEIGDYILVLEKVKGRK